MCLRGGGPIGFPMFSMDLRIVWTASILSTAPDAVLLITFGTFVTSVMAHKLATWHEV